MPVVPRTSFNRSLLVRLLADLHVADVPDPTQTVAETLSQWLDWTDAIALSGALGGSEAAGVAPRPSVRPGAGRTMADAAERLRRELTQGIAKDEVLGSGPVGADGEEADFGPCRQRYLAQQQVMSTRIGALRAQARAALSARSPALGQLAALDAVLDEGLAGRERHLLAGVPVLLERHFKRRRSAPDGPAGGGAGAAGRTLQQALLAELDLRLQPVEGLIEALGDEAKEPS